jgi:hypothetical protein
VHTTWQQSTTCAGETWQTMWKTSEQLVLAS